MSDVCIEALFARYRDRGDPDALSAVFDHLAPRLLLVAAHMTSGHDAEDLVQATFVDAIRHSARWDAERPLAPWLLGLLANHVREAHRQRRRVPDPQRIVSRLPRLPESEAAANECLLVVSNSIEGLPRHYRQVLSLRLVHGFDLQQIANSLDVPLGTVKVRLHRGLLLLRQALPASMASTIAVLLLPGVTLAAVREHVLRAAADTTVGAGVATGIGIALGGMVMKQFVAVLALAMVAVVGWMVLTWPQSVTVPIVSDREPVAVSDTASGPAEEPGEASPGAVAARAVSDVALTRSALPTTGSLTIRTVWAADAAPAPFVRIKAHLGDSKPGEPPVALTTDAVGLASCVGLVPGRYRFELPPHALRSPTGEITVEVNAGATAHCDVPIAGDMQLRVVVVDREGTVQVGAGVWCHDSMAQGEPTRELGMTDANGELHFRGLPLLKVWARMAGREPSPFHEFASSSSGGPRRPVDVRLALGTAACTVLGTVLDANARPANKAKVMIACDDTASPSRTELVMWTDAAGRFFCDEVPCGERSVVAVLPEFAPACARITTAVDTPTTVVLTLRLGMTLSGRLADAAGQPIANKEITVIARSEDAPTGMTSLYGQMRRTTTAADGHYRLTAIVAGSITARAATDPLLEKQLVGSEGADLEWNPVAEPERAITGRLLDHDDRPLAGWTVAVHALTLASMFRRPASVQTDAQGHFRAVGLEDAAYRLHAFAPIVAGQDPYGIAARTPRAELSDVRPAPEPITMRVEANALASGWIEGSLLVPAGREVRAMLSLYPKAMTGLDNTTTPRERLSTGQTNFRLGPLPPGAYDLLCTVEGCEGVRQNGLRVEPEATLRLPPWDLAAQRALVLSLRLPDGTAVTGATVCLLLVPRLVCRELSPGRYESPPVGEGPWRAVVRGPDILPGEFVLARLGAGPTEVVLQPGTRVDLCVQPPTPRLRWTDTLALTIRDAHGTSVVREAMRIDTGAEWRLSLGLSPGAYEVEVGLLSFTDRSKAVATVVVGAAPVKVDLQLAK